MSQCAYHLFPQAVIVNVLIAIETEAERNAEKTDLSVMFKKVGVCSLIVICVPFTSQNALHLK